MSTIHENKRDLEFQIETMFKDFIDENPEIRTMNVTVDVLYDKNEKLEGTTVDIELELKEGRE